MLDLKNYATIHPYIGITNDSIMNKSENRIEKNITQGMLNKNNSADDLKPSGRLHNMSSVNIYNSMHKLDDPFTYNVISASYEPKNFKFQ